MGPNRGRAAESPTPGLAASRAVEYARGQGGRFLAELKQLVRFPTVSAHPRHAGDLRACAAWLARHLRDVGLSHVRVLTGRGHPLVWAASSQRPDRPTLLIYGHYDVQPPDPLGEWRSPPFDPVVRGTNLYGRGASDDKGQLFCHVKALESYLRTSGELPVNVKCLFEGEEEIGSPNLAGILARHPNAFACDVAVASDTGMLGPGRPALIFSLRGSLALELEIRGPSRDLHSGTFGGAVHNPIQALCEIVARLHDAEGRVAIPGFYDRVRCWGEAERASTAAVGPPDAQILGDAGARRGWGERGWSAYERTTIRPALTLNGISGGYQGSGGKGVVPATAAAKLSVRLVPDQDPREIERLFHNYVTSITPPTVRSTLRSRPGTAPALIDRGHPAMHAAASAYRRGFGSSPVFLRSGGTIPAVSILKEVLGVSTILMGFGLPDDRRHAPNEKFDLANFANGISTCVWFLSELQRRSRRRDATRSPGTRPVRGRA